MKILENQKNCGSHWNSLGLPSKNKSGSKICLNVNGKLNFEPKVNAHIFKNFFSNLADDLLKKLPNPKNKFNMDSVKSHYVKTRIEREIVIVFSYWWRNHFKIVTGDESIKAAGIDGLAGKFIKDGAPYLSSPITQLCNLSISLSTFPEKCKIAKLKPIV